MPAPGPGGAWIDDFEGNKLDSKWISSRHSDGGQNDGVWTRRIKDSKVYWNGVNTGTENNYWGEILSLPVNAPGDISIEALIRMKRTDGVYGSIGVGFNHANANAILKYGGVLFINASSPGYVAGENNTTLTPFPGFPSQLFQGSLGADIIMKIRVIRKNNYAFIYMGNLYVGQYAYANTITTVDIVNYWYFPLCNNERWVDYISVWPRECVK